VSRNTFPKEKALKLTLHRKLVFESILTSWALVLITRIGTRHLLAALFFLLSLLLLEAVSQQYAKVQVPLSLKRTALGLGLLFTFFYLCGDFEGICGELTNLLFRLFVLGVAGIGLFILFYKVLLLLFLFLFVRIIGCSLVPAPSTCFNRMNNACFGMLSWLTCMACWTPYLLKSFPGILTIDSMNQYAQIIGIYGQNNHHPWVHTQLIRLFYRIGLLFTSDPSKAVAFYTVAQMCFMAFCVSYLMCYLHRFRLKTRVYLLVLAFYALVPYNAAYAISMIKDTMFGGFALLYTLALLTLLLRSREAPLTFRKNRGTLLLLIISGGFFSLFRSNGFYAFLIMIPFVVWSFRKSLRVIVPAQAAILLAVLLVKGPVMDACGVIQPDLVESLSIPGQQISRVLMNGRELTGEQSAFLNRIMDTSRMPEGYNPHVSDWFKRLVRMGDAEYLSGHFGEFLKIYMELGLRYPGDYLIAYRDQTIGYWFPLSDQPEIALNEGVCENEFGLQTQAVLKGPLVIKVNEILFKLHLIFPFYGLLWSVGALFWIILICMCITGLFQKDKRLLLLYLPAIGIFLTLMLATPVGKDFRYAYGYVYCMPLYLLLPFIKTHFN